MPIHKNTCPAFFLDATFDSSGAYSPCTALGGGAVHFGTQFVDEIWNSTVLEDLREQSSAGAQLPMCNRCWSEEKINFTSERNYLIRDLPPGVDYTDPAYYKAGPRHLNIKVSNICNLRCRTCQSKDSYLYHIEGAYYENRYNIKNSYYTLEHFKKHFTDQQLDKLYNFSSDVERIELYGGEPFLDEQIPKYLLRLIDSGQAQHIDFSVSTNCTHPLTDTWRRILTGFRNVVINISVDGLNNQFTYMRHPGKWHDAEKNIREFFKLRTRSPNITVQPVITVSALNVTVLDSVYQYFKKYRVTPFIILVQFPAYYCVNVIPAQVRPWVESKLRAADNPDFDAVITLLNTPQKSFDNTWNQFRFWTQAKDEYRNENFVEVFDEFGAVLLENNLW